MYAIRSYYVIQAVLNIGRNAAQAVEGVGQITFRTRAARQVTLAKRRHKLALELQVIDNGPGIPNDIRDQIFYPLVSGRDGGSGLRITSYNVCYTKLLRDQVYYPQKNQLFRYRMDYFLKIY